MLKINQLSLCECYLFKPVTHITTPVLFGIYFVTVIAKSENSDATRLSRLVLQSLRNSRNYTRELSPFFFSFPQCTFASHSPSSNQAFYSELPENICGFHAAPGAPGIQLSEVCSLHWDCLETAQGPWNSPTFMPLNQSKPPLSFLLYSAFAFFFLPLFLPPSLGHWCQTDLLCAGVCFCSSMPVCICTDECMCGCAAASQDVRFICCVNVCMYLYF